MSTTIQFAADPIGIKKFLEEGHILVTTKRENIKVCERMGSEAEVTITDKKREIQALILQTLNQTVEKDSLLDVFLGAKPHHPHDQFETYYTAMSYAMQAVVTEDEGEHTFPFPDNKKIHEIWDKISYEFNVILINHFNLCVDLTFGKTKEEVRIFFKTYLVIE